MKKAKEFIGKVIAWFDTEWKMYLLFFVMGIIVTLILF